MKNYCVVIVLLVFADVTWYSTNTSTTADVRNRDNGNIIQGMPIKMEKAITFMKVVEKMSKKYLFARRPINY